MAIAKELLFNDGEALDHNDLNAAQRFMSAKLQDSVLRERCNLGLALGPNINTERCWTDSIDCYPYPHATAMHVSNKLGTILQIIGDPVTGSAPQTLMYTLAEDELDTAVTTAHATLERTDSIFLALTEAAGGAETRDFEDAITHVLSSQTFNKRLNVVCTKTYTAGTPATTGTSVAPITPVGAMRFCDVLVPAASTAITTDRLRDTMYPMRQRAIDASCFSPDWYPFSAGGWTRTVAGLWSSAGAGNELHLYLRTTGHHSARLVAITLYAQLQAGATVRLRYKGLDTFTTPTVATLETVTPSLPLAGKTVLTPAGGSWGSAYGPDARPVWLNGYAAGRAAYFHGTPAAGTARAVFLEIVAGGAGDVVSFARANVLGF